MRKIFIIPALVSSLLIGIKPSASDIVDDTVKNYKDSTKYGFKLAKSSYKLKKFFQVQEFSINSFGKEDFVLPIILKYFTAGYTFYLDFYYTNYLGEKTLCEEYSLENTSTNSSGLYKTFTFRINDEDMHPQVVDFSLDIKCVSTGDETFYASQSISFQLCRSLANLKLDDVRHTFYTAFEYKPGTNTGTGYKYIGELEFTTIKESRNLLLEYDSINPRIFKIATSYLSTNLEPILLIPNVNNYFSDFVWEDDINFAAFPLFLNCYDNVERRFTCSLWDQSAGGEYNFYYDKSAKRMTKNENENCIKVDSIFLPLNDAKSFNPLNCRMLVKGISSNNVSAYWDFKINFDIAEDKKIIIVDETLNKVTDNDFFEE